MFTQQQLTTGLTLSAGLLLIGCGASGPAGPLRGTTEWYWQNAMTSYSEGSFSEAIEDLNYAADGEDEWAMRARVLRPLLIAGIARANIAVADDCRIALEKNPDRAAMIRTPLQQAERDARQNIIAFVEGLGAFKTALGNGDVTLDFPFPPGNRNESAAMKSLQSGEKISEMQFQGGIREVLQYGLVETVSLASGAGKDFAKAQALFDARPVTVNGEQFKLIVAGLLTGMSGTFTQKKMNDPKIREIVLQRADEWIASGLESTDADLKKQAEDLKFDIENERRDMKGLAPLRR